MGEEDHFTLAGFRNDIIENAHCRLQANADIKLNSIILYEVFTIDEASKLFDGIDKLFSTANGIEQGRAEGARAHFQSQRLMGSGGIYYLPIIRNKCIYGEPTAFYYHTMEFSKDFSYIKIGIFKPTPTLLVARIIARLTTKASTKLNQILYNLHLTSRGPTYYKGGYRSTRYYNPREQKEQAIQEKVSAYQLAIAKFIMPFFSGEFLSKIYENVVPQVSVVPSIMVYSCEYPTDKNGFDTWLNDSFGALRCLGIVTFPSASLAFEHDGYLLFENETNTGYRNLSIIADPKQISVNPEEADGEIIHRLESISFIDFALERFVFRQAVEMGRLNSKTSDIMAKSSKYNLDDIINIKKQASEHEYLVRRHVIERQTGMVHSYDEDVLFTYRDKPDLKLFKSFADQIDKDAGQLMALGDFIGKQLDSVLGIKNLEYGKRNQLLTTVLAIVVIVLTVIQLLKP